MRDNARAAGEFGAKREKRPAFGSAWVDYHQVFN